MATLRRRFNSERALGSAILFFCLAFSAVGHAEPKLSGSPPGVLIIDDSHPDAPFGRQLRAEIHSRMDEELTIGYALYPEYLDVAISSPTDDTTARAYIGDKHRKHRINAIVAIGANATEFALRLRMDWWPDVPLIYVGFDEALVSRERYPNTIGVIAPRQFQNIVRAARIVVPQLSRLILIGSLIETQPYRRQYLLEIPQLKNEVELVNLTGLTIEQTKSQIDHLPLNSVIAYLPFHADVSGLFHTQLEALRAVTSAANRPIVVDTEGLVGEGPVGGIVPSGEKIGRQVAHELARVLKGEETASIPTQHGSYTEAQFDARQLQRWGISEGALPADAVIRFREIGPWQRYRWQIVTAIAVLLAESGIIAALLYERRRRRSAETESHQHLLEVTQMDRALTASGISSSIAHELNQPLTAIMGNAEAALMLIETNSTDHEQLKQIVEDIRRDDQRAADIIKHLRMLLRHTEMQAQDVDLSDIMRETLSLIQSQAEESATKVKADIVQDDVHVRADSVHVQQVVLNLAINAMEAMQNQPEDERLLELRLDKKESEAVVSISDTGSGIPVDKIKTIFNPFVTTKTDGTGLGLSIARTIIDTYGGRIWVENNARRGATFRFSLRLAA